MRLAMSITTGTIMADIIETVIITSGDVAFTGDTTTIVDTATTTQDTEGISSMTDVSTKENTTKNIMKIGMKEKEVMADMNIADKKRIEI